MNQTINKSDVLKGDYITRTVKASNVTVKCINLTDFSLVDKVYTINGEFDAIKTASMIEKRYGAQLIQDGFKVVKVIDISTTEKRLAMNLALFIEHGFKITPDNSTDVLKGDYITRTVKASNVTVKCINLTDFSLVDKVYTINGEFDAIKTASMIEKRYGAQLIQDGFKVVKVISQDVIEMRYAMALSEFTEYAFEIVD